MKSENLAFVKFSPLGHFYSPIPNLREIKKNSVLIFDQSAISLDSISIADDQQVKLLQLFRQFYREIPFSDKKVAHLRYYFDNAYFSYGDGFILYSFLRYWKPKRVIEIGSGYSSALMLDVNDSFFNNKINFTFIEPYTERLQRLLTQRDGVNIEPIPVQEVALEKFSNLEENDILFIDSSHVAKIGSDVLHIIFNIFPLLKRGVIIHFHDILWPFQYPKKWVKGGRAWNEAYFVRAFLQNNSEFEILYFNSYMETHHKQTLKGMAPICLKHPSSKVTVGNSSLWLRRT